jgi:hypothetical protein
MPQIQCVRGFTEDAQLPGLLFFGLEKQSSRSEVIILADEPESKVSHIAFFIYGIDFLTSHYFFCTFNLTE